MKLKYFCSKKMMLWLIVVLITGCVSNIQPGADSTLLPPQQIDGLTSTPFPKEFFPEGQIAFVRIDANGDDGIYVMDTDSKDLRNLTPTIPYSRNPSWSPDGKYIAFVSPVNGVNQIFSVQTDGSKLRQLTFSGFHSYNPVWLPDGEHIVFLSQRNDILDSQGIPIQQGYIMNSDGSAERRLTNDQEFVNAISWYPKDELLSVAVAYTRHTLRIYIIDLNGNIQSQFPEFIIDGVPSWSPDGEQIAFYTSREGCSGILLAKADGSDQKCLVIDKIYPPIRIGGVSWTPDGAHIIFSSNLDGDSDLYSVKVDGSSLVQLTNLLGEEGTPTWWILP